MSRWRSAPLLLLPQRRGVLLVVHLISVAAIAKSAIVNVYQSLRRGLRPRPASDVAGVGQATGARRRLRGRQGRPYLAREALVRGPLNRGGGANGAD